VDLRIVAGLGLLTLLLGFLGGCLWFATRDFRFRWQHRRRHEQRRRERPGRADEEITIRR
jgi:hypothetical protein